MISFLFKGLLRDRSRSVFPILVIIAGVMLTVFLHTWIEGAISNMVWSNASLQAGHVKIMSAAYAEQAEQLPNDLALLGMDSLIAEVNKTYPDLTWTPRIRFGGLLDIPDEFGETRTQGPTFGLAVELLKPDSPDLEILNLDQALIHGRLPQKQGEILISDEFAHKLQIDLGETATLISSTMYGSLAMYNFEVVGTIRFGITAMDRSAIVADIRDIQQALDMENTTGEILGFFNDFQYYEKNADEIKTLFNEHFQNSQDEFSPIMQSLRDQNGLGEMLDMFSAVIGVIITIFVFVMFIVLWNAGLMGSLRRYGEIGVRLAIGEDKGHVYRTMLVESLAVGITASVIGTALGLAVSFYLQNNGINMNSLFKGSSVLMSYVMRTQVTDASYVIGFLPGIVATLLGTAAAGVGIYKRPTSQLFKELEV